MKTMFSVVLALLALAPSSLALASEDPTLGKLKLVAGMVDELKSKMPVSEALTEVGVRDLTVFNMPLKKHLCLTLLHKGEGVTIFFSDPVLLKLEDGVLRAVVAHELAHVALGHLKKNRARLSASEITASEREADLLAGALLGRAAMVQMLKSLAALLGQENLDGAWSRRAVADRIQALEN